MQATPMIKEALQTITGLDRIFGISVVFVDVSVFKKGKAKGGGNMKNAEPVYLCAGRKEFCLIDTELRDPGKEGSTLEKLPYENLDFIELPKEANSRYLLRFSFVDTPSKSCVPSLLMKCPDREAVLKTIMLYWKTDRMIETCEPMDLPLKDVKGDPAFAVDNAWSPPKKIRPGLKAHEYLDYFFQYPTFFALEEDKNHLFFTQKPSSDDEMDDDVERKRMIEIFFSAMKPISSNPLSLKSVKRVAEDTLHEIGSNVKNFRLVSSPGAFIKRTNITGDPAAWSGYKIHVQTMGKNSNKRRASVVENREIAIMVLRRKYIPPLMEMYQDITITMYDYGDEGESVESWLHRFHVEGVDLKNFEDVLQDTVRSKTDGMNEKAKVNDMIRYIASTELTEDGDFDYDAFNIPPPERPNFDRAMDGITKGNLMSSLEEIADSFASAASLYFVDKKLTQAKANALMLDDEGYAFYQKAMDIDPHHFVHAQRFVHSISDLIKGIQSYVKKMDPHSAPKEIKENPFEISDKLEQISPNSVVDRQKTHPWCHRVWRYLAYVVVHGLRVPVDAGAGMVMEELAPLQVTIKRMVQAIRSKGKLHEDIVKKMGTAFPEAGDDRIVDELEEEEKELLRKKKQEREKKILEKARPHIVVVTWAIARLVRVLETLLYFRRQGKGFEFTPIEIHVQLCPSYHETGVTFNESIMCELIRNGYFSSRFAILKNSSALPQFYGLLIHQFIQGRCSVKVAHEVCKSFARISEFKDLSKDFAVTPDTKEQAKEGIATAMIPVIFELLKVRNESLRVLGIVSLVNYSAKVESAKKIIYNTPKVCELLVPLIASPHLDLVRHSCTLLNNLAAYRPDCLDSIVTEGAVRLILNMLVLNLNNLSKTSVILVTSGVKLLRRLVKEAALAKTQLVSLKLTDLIVPKSFLDSYRAEREIPIGLHVLLVLLKTSDVDLLTEVALCFRNAAYASNAANKRVLGKHILIRILLKLKRTKVAPTVCFTMLQCIHILLLNALNMEFLIGKDLDKDDDFDVHEILETIQDSFDNQKIKKFVKEIKRKLADATSKEGMVFAPTNIYIST